MSELTLVAAGLTWFVVKVTVVLRNGEAHQSEFKTLEISSASAHTEGVRRAESHFGERVSRVSVVTHPAR